MTTRRIRRGQAERDGDWLVGLLVLLVRFFFKLIVVPLLLIMFRPSLALFVLGSKKVVVLVAAMTDADPGMYKRKRWRKTRKPVYWRNKNNLGNGDYFVCEATGYKSYDLSEFHCDHYLPRLWFPLLAYDQSNLRLVRDKVNIDKGAALHAWPLLRFFFMRKSTTIIILTAAIGIYWRWFL